MSVRRRGSALHLGRFGRGSSLLRLVHVPAFRDTFGTLCRLQSDSNTEYPYINDALAYELQDKREEFGESLRRSPVAVQLTPGHAHIWTFAGGRINHTLRYIFALLGDFKVSSDNFQLRIEGNTVTHKGIKEVIQRKHEPEFWADRSVLQGILAALLEYRLSKFQRALPAEYSEEMVTQYLTS